MAVITKIPATKNKFTAAPISQKQKRRVAGYARVSTDKKEQILSSIAQEEARNISENVTWGQRKRFADGKMIMPYKRFLGYDKGNDGKPVINWGYLLH